MKLRGHRPGRTVPSAGAADAVDDRHRAFGEVGSEDRPPHPGRVWNRIHGGAGQEIVAVAPVAPDCRPEAWLSGWPMRCKTWCQGRGSVASGSSATWSPARPSTRSGGHCCHWSGDTGQATRSSTARTCPPPVRGHGPNGATKPALADRRHPHWHHWPPRGLPRHEPGRRQPRHPFVGKTIPRIVF